MEERISKTTFFDTYRMSSCKKLFYSTKILAFAHIIKLIRLDFKTTINNAIYNIIGESLARNQAKVRQGRNTFWYETELIRNIREVDTRVDQGSKSSIEAEESAASRGYNGEQSRSHPRVFNRFSAQVSCPSV